MIPKVTFINIGGDTEGCVPNIYIGISSKLGGKLINIGGDPEGHPVVIIIVVSAPTSIVLQRDPCQ